jgi:hypothetical protein
MPTSAPQTLRLIGLVWLMDDLMRAKDLPPILDHKQYVEPPVFRLQNLLREAHGNASCPIYRRPNSASLIQMAT